MAANRPYYDIIRDVLLRNIATGRLPAGTRLYVNAVADRLSVSRSPVKRALEIMADAGEIARSEGQGYVVPPTDAAAAPARVNLHLLDLDLDERVSETLVAPSWERIYEEVEAEVLNCTPFGTYQISEALLVTHFDVSRTVIREVLARLHGRSLIRKDRASHWVAGPLSARMLDDAHDIRRLLEPAAVAAAAGRIDRSQLTAMREALRAALSLAGGLRQDQVEDLEADLHDTCAAASRNRLLVETVRISQIGRVVNRLFGTYIGVHDEIEMLVEHRLVFDHLLLGDGAGAEAAMRFHLDADHDRARDRLKVLSVFDDPEIAPWLTRMH